MTTPFPGMDPYLEGYLWPDVHQELASVIKGLLAPQISPGYVARLSSYTVEDTSPEETYTRSLYHLSINYREDPPPPALKVEEQDWMRELLDIKVKLMPE